jgi:molecular chaperone GrpE
MSAHHDKEHKKHDNKAETEAMAEVLKKAHGVSQENFKEECDKALEEVAKLKEQILLMAADGENLRKRTAKQIEDAEKFAINKFAKDLIDVLENLYLAADNIPSDALEKDPVLLSIFKGIEMTKTNLLGVLEKYGVKRIAPENGEMFDHNYHQAVAQNEHPELPTNSIINVMRAGYSLHDRLVKPAMVVVAKKAQE